MRKADIVQRITEDTGCPTTQAAQAVETILAVIKADLRQGGR